jgi:hypothetical protein
MRFSILRIGFSYAYTVRPNYSFRRISPRRRQTKSVQVPLCNKDNNQKDVCKEQTETPQHPRINLFSFSLILFFHFSGESSFMQEIDEPFT